MVMRRTFIEVSGLTPIVAISFPISCNLTHFVNTFLILFAINKAYF